MLYYCTEDCQDLKFECDTGNSGERLCPDCSMEVLGLTFNLDGQVHLPFYWDADLIDNIIESLKEHGEYNGYTRY